MSTVYTRQAILSPYFIKINSEAFQVENDVCVTLRRFFTMNILISWSMYTSSNLCTISPFCVDCVVCSFRHYLIYP